MSESVEVIRRAIDLLSTSAMKLDEDTDAWWDCIANLMLLAKREEAREGGDELKIKIPGKYEVQIEHYERYKRQRETEASRETADRAGRIRALVRKLRW